MSSLMLPLVYCNSHTFKTCHKTVTVPLNNKASIFIFFSMKTFLGSQHGQPAKNYLEYFPVFSHSLSHPQSPCFHFICLLLSLHFSPALSVSFPLSAITVLLLMPLTGGYLHPYMFSLQLYHGSNVLPNISALCWWSPLWGVLPAALHYIFPLFRISQRGLCHLAVLGPKCYLTPDNSSNHHHHNITSGIISCGDLFLSLSSGHERKPIWNNERWQICCTRSRTATPFSSLQEIPIRFRNIKSVNTFLPVFGHVTTVTENDLKYFSVLPISLYLSL